MKIETFYPARRKFLKTSGIITAGLTSLCTFPSISHASAGPEKSGLYVIGPMEGYSPQIGTIVSMLNYNRSTVIAAVKSLSKSDLDHLHDPNANTIGALILHLCAVDKFYQINTFEGKQKLEKEDEEFWLPAMNLGDEGRKKIKGHEINFYIDLLAEIRAKTLIEFKKKDDKWLMAIDPEWSKEEPINTYWKWFHVCEHESNHRGQINWLKGRLPGAKAGKD